jgi:hypothetical protein
MRRPALYLALAGALAGAILVGRVSASAPSRDSAAAPAAAAAPAPAEAVAVIDAAVARGTWTARDRDQVRRLMLGRGPAELQALFARFAPAVNSGQMRVEAMEGPLL